MLARLSDDWQDRYEHPVLVVETFVDPDRFQGTVYQASGWTELGRTKGNGRHARDFYENHGKPKQLFVRELNGSSWATFKVQRTGTFASTGASAGLSCAACRLRRALGASSRTKRRLGFPWFS